MRQLLLPLFLLASPLAAAGPIAWSAGTAAAPLMEDFEGFASVSRYPNPLTGGDQGTFTRINGGFISGLFAGQTGSALPSGHEAASGTPTGPLTLMSQGSYENVGVFDESSWGAPGYSNSVYGVIGGKPDSFDGFALGAVSVLFDRDMGTFGMSVTGVDGTGDLVLDFFERGGALLDRVVVAAANLTEFGPIAFVSAGPRFAGITIANTDPLGLNYDNFRFVPLPSTLALFAIGFAGSRTRLPKRPGHRAS